MCSVHRLGYVYQNINRKVVHLYLILVLGFLKFKALRSIAAKYGFVINALTGLLRLGHCTFIGNLDSRKLHFTAF